MHIDSNTTKRGGRSYTRHLLRESYRESGKVKKRTLANLSSCSDAEIEAIKLALRHKDKLEELGAVDEQLTLSQGLSAGAVSVVYQTASRLGIVAALGSSADGKLALWQVIARVIEQGSRLSAVRLARRHAAVEILNIREGFTEDDLYRNLSWLESEQQNIEDRLYRRSKSGGATEELFLYDVTSTYLEGTKNELAAFGYNRDKKRGKMQIVVGLLCDSYGDPLSIEVFPGNTGDASTFFSQVKKIAHRFGAESVTLVGDRGMIKAPQIAALSEHDFHYITAITKPQIESLIVRGAFQYSFFDEDLSEVTYESVRYVLRRNPHRADEMAANRQEKMKSLVLKVQRENQRLQEHSRSKVATVQRTIESKIAALRMPWVSLNVTGRELSLVVNEQMLEEKARLDGCYVLKTNLNPDVASKQIVHDRYKDLAFVESAFRTSKTVNLEMRPVYVCKEESTKGHALVVMLAYKIVRELSKCWQHFDLSVEEGLRDLATICTIQVQVKNTASFNSVPKPRTQLANLIKAANAKLPAALPPRKVIVDTRKSLTSEQKT